MTNVETVNKKAAVFWMLFPVALLVVSVSGWLVMVRIAVNDPGFSVESDYYKKAASYDDELARQRDNAALGLSARVQSFEYTQKGDAVMVVSLEASDGTPAVGYVLSATAFPVARGNQVQSLQFDAASAGLHQAGLVKVRPGLWEVRILAEKSGRRFTQVLRTEISDSAERKAPS